MLPQDTLIFPSCAFLLSDFYSCIILLSKNHPYSLKQHRCLVLKTFVLHLVLSSKDALDSLRQHCCLCFLLFQEGFHSWDMWDMCLSLSICLPFSTRTSLFFHLLVFQGHESLAYLLWRSYQILHMEWSLDFGSSVGCLGLRIWFRSLAMWFSHKMCLLW